MIVAILQARYSSTRLPGKVMKTLVGIPMFLHQIERVMQSKLISKLIVATSTNQTDDCIQEICNKNQFAVYRGSLDDVLDRFYQCAVLYKPIQVVRLTADCPLTDWRVIDNTIDFHLAGCFDYSSNSIDSNFPDGLDVEVLKFSCLAEAWQKAKLPSEREHVTSYIYNRPNQFKLGSFKGEVNLSHHRWTVDEQNDFYFVNQVYELLYRSNNMFTSEDILALLDKRPDLKKLNYHIGRNEGMQSSFKKDEIFINSK